MHAWKRICLCEIEGEKFVCVCVRERERKREGEGGNVLEITRKTKSQTKSEDRYWG